ncbi:metallophosphoesterase [Rhodobacter sp.]
MIRILHLSDPHFGTVETGLDRAVLALAARLAPDATVVSGDLTQRARRAEFAAAREWVDRLPRPVLVVPGNHDAPLYNLLGRLLRPYAGYAASFGADLEPVLSLPGAVVQGINTANPLVWKAGRLRQSSVDRLRRSFAAAPPDDWRIAAMHHAPVPAADGTAADIADPPGTLRALAETGAQIVLSGHTHMPHWGVAETAAGMLFLQVGTAISTRRKTAANDLGLIELDDRGVTVRSWHALPGGPFTEGPGSRFLNGPTGWQRVEP